MTRHTTKYTFFSVSIGIVIIKELYEYMADTLYLNNISGSPFHQITRPRVTDCIFNDEYAVRWGTVLLDR